MYLVARIDLDYVPWDTPDAAEFGHAEPATLLRMLDLSQKTGYKYHFFASTRVAVNLPTALEAALGHGHEVDWLCKQPSQLAEEWPTARTAFRAAGHSIRGVALKGSWPADAPATLPEDLTFITATGEAPDMGRATFPVNTFADREGLRAEKTMRSWADEVRAKLRDSAMLNHGEILVFRPQVLGKVDPQLRVFREVLDLGLAVGLKMKTLRELTPATAT